MNFQRYSHYLHKIRTNPPSVTFRQATRKIAGRLSTTVDRVRVQWLSPSLSDDDFLRSLTEPFSTVERFLEHIATRSTPKFFITAQTRPDVLAALHTLCPQSSVSIRNAADDVCKHLFDLLGSGTCQLGKVIDWHSDFKSGHRWNPRQYYTDIRPAPYPGGYDLKMPWELSRCQHFVWLGQAYWLTDDEKYAQEFVDQVTDWIVQNPPRLGVNWACAMDVAIRVVNWLWGYYFFQNSAALTNQFLLTFFKSILEHGRHIFKNLEFSETLTSNHYLSDIVGLVYLGILLPEFTESQRWRIFGLQELEKEMFKQVYADGVGFEASISYHRLSAELFLSATLLARLNGHIFSNDYMERLEKMLEFTMYVTKPDGTVPLIGDCDNGRLHRLKAWGGQEQEWLDHRYLLAIGSTIFERVDFAQAAGDQWEEAFWIFGAKAAPFIFSKETSEIDQFPLTSHAFINGGFYILRQDDYYVIVNAGSNGQNGNGGHAHNDKLSFEFSIGNRTIVGDPGAYIYTADHVARNQFRSGCYHNGITVKDEEVCRFPLHNLFALSDDVHPLCKEWEVTPEYTLLVVEHTGYQRLIRPIICRRLFYLDNTRSMLITADQVFGTGEQILEANFQCLSPIYKLEATKDHVIGKWKDGGFRVSQINSDGWQAHIIEGEYSTSYGTRQESPKFVYRWQGKLSTQLILSWTVLSSKDELKPITMKDLPSSAQAAIQKWLT